MMIVRGGWVNLRVWRRDARMPPPSVGARTFRPQAIVPVPTFLNVSGLIVFDGGQRVRCQGAHLIPGQARVSMLAPWLRPNEFWFLASCGRDKPA